MSTRFTLKGASEDLYEDVSLISETRDTTNYNSILYMDQFKPKINNNEVWRSDINPIDSR